MHRKPYSLWKRKLPSGRIVFYVRFRLDDGSWGVAKSSGQRTKTAAEAWAIDYLRSGQIVQKENQKFAQIAQGFFSPDGPYTAARARRGKQIGRGHAANQQSYIENYLNPAFGSLRVSRIDSDAVEEFTQELIGKGLSSSSINHILLALKIVLQYAYKKKLVARLPIIERVAHTQSERGILSIEEAKAFFALPWGDPRHYVINLIAATTGMRMGEIRGLQRKAVFANYLEVSTSWERGHGLKGTKSGRSRFVPLTERASTALADLMSKSPYTEPEDLVFYGRRRETPIDHKLIERALYAAYAQIGIDEQQRRERGLCFHSWRHFFNSLLINARVPVPKVQTLTGHSSNRMTEAYFHADEYTDVIAITGRI